jgi:hypothetical protein
MWQSAQLKATNFEPTRKTHRLPKRQQFVWKQFFTTKNIKKRKMGKAVVPL